MITMTQLQREEITMAAAPPKSPVGSSEILTHISELSHLCSIGHGVFQSGVSTMSIIPDW